MHFVYNGKWITVFFILYLASKFSLLKLICNSILTFKALSLSFADVLSDEKNSGHLRCMSPAEAEQGELCLVLVLMLETRGGLTV